MVKNPCQKDFCLALFFYFCSLITTWSSMQKKKIVFIYNPISGVTGKRMILRQIEKRLDKDSFSYEIRKTAYAGHAKEITREAVAAGADIVCAIGGDGTMNEVGCALRGTDTALAIIPCGSGNGLARHLHIPLDAISAIELINRSSVSKMDYGLINGHPFFCTCGVGFDAFISEKFARSKTRGPLAYVESVLTAGLKYNPETYGIDMTLEKEERSVQKAFLISCANASQYGNNFYIAPQASVRDGLLDVTIIKPFTVIDAPQIALHLLSGNIASSNYVSTFRCRSLTVHRQHPGVVHFDGDPMETDAEVEVSIVQDGLYCVCPQEEGMTRVVENIQTVVLEQIRTMQMRSEELLETGGRTNRMLIQQTQKTNRMIKEQFQKIIDKIGGKAE